MDDMDRMKARIKELTGWRHVPRPRIIDNTSNCMNIGRGDVVRLEGRDFAIEGYKYESRFGIDDQPKYWVLGAIDMETGIKKILKAEFHEEFHVHIGIFKIRCFRSSEKEARVLELVRGDPRFMQGITLKDARGDLVRVLDIIKGPNIFEAIHDIQKSHRDYFEQDLPCIAHRLRDCLEAIVKLHDAKTCHGDIRNDHILIDAETGRYRWIDFDLNQHVSDFDTWSMGNILNYAFGKGINAFQQVLQDDHFSHAIKNSLLPEDGSAFYEYRIMNLGKLYPYLPEEINHILQHFTLDPVGVYDNMHQLTDDYCQMLDAVFPGVKIELPGSGS